MTIKKNASGSNHHLRKIDSIGENFSFDATKNSQQINFTPVKTRRKFSKMPKHDPNKIHEVFSNLNTKELDAMINFILDEPLMENISDDLLKESNISDIEKKILQNVAVEIRNNISVASGKHRDGFKIIIENDFYNNNFDCAVLGLIANYLYPTTLDFFLDVNSSNDERKKCYNEMPYNITNPADTAVA